ncbi:MAG: M3 family metallopeptidase, partial [Bacteroidota bacterium]
MKRPLLLLFSLLILAFTMNGQQSKKENPFFKPYTTPFQVPPFDKIDTGDYMPAFLEGMRQHNIEIDAITENKAQPDFNNTILAFDKSGLMLSRVAKVFYNISEANTSDALQDIARRLDPIATKHQDDIYLNDKLFARIKSVYSKRHEMNLDPQQIRVTEKYYRDFERKGANLSDLKKDELRKINTELSMQSLTFGENLLAENKDFKLIVDNIKDLEGLPKDLTDAAAETARAMKLDGKWVFTMAKPSWIPLLQYAKNRALREKLYRGWFMRGNNGNANDNNQVVSRITDLRVKQANLLGYPSYAAYVIDENMAKTPEKVDEFLSKLWKSALPVAKNEADEMQQIIRREGGSFNLESWDWWYYAEKVHKEKYNLDESELKPYLELSNVRDGMFFVAQKLYGITFTRITNLPVYEKSVETFEVKEADGKHLGILYLDYFPRDGKKGGAWCTDFQSSGWRDGKKVDPVISVVTNFPAPSGDMPSLLSWDDAKTLFHEFGHALHGLFTVGKYDRTAGNVPQDYVELPSQVNENWASEPEVLKHYAKHYKTGAVIPDQLIEKIQKSSLFNQGFETVEYLAASILDMDYHEMKTPVKIIASDFEKKAMDRIGLIPEIIPRYKSTYFSHIIGGGYAAW